MKGTLMNVLIVIETPGGQRKDQRLALVNSLLLKDYDLDKIDGNIVNVDDVKEKYANQIVELYKRFGLEERVEEKWEVWRKPKKVPVDLVDCLDPVFPVQVDKVIRIGWAV